MSFLLGTTFCTVQCSCCVNALPSSTSFLLRIICKIYGDRKCVNALPSSTSFLQEECAYKFSSMFCVNALPSSTSFLRLGEISLKKIDSLCQCSSELHVISTATQDKRVRFSLVVSMLFRAPRHFYPPCQKPLIYKAF